MERTNLLLQKKNISKQIKHIRYLLKLKNLSKEEELRLENLLEALKSSRTLLSFSIKKEKILFYETEARRLLTLTLQEG